MCSGTNPIACHFGGNPGNYEVTVELGGSSAADTSVMAEFSREMLPPVATSANEKPHYTMTVNVRHPEGQPVADLGNPASGLDLYFWGNNKVLPALSGIGYAPAPSPIVVYLATDSTGCDQFDTAYAGWGQWLPQYFTSAISIANYGNSGVDTPGFAGGSAYWNAIKPLLTSKDFLLIELGDNDKTDTAAVITQGLTTMIAGAKAKGATPLLMTPVQRALFTGNNVNAYITNSTGANVPTIMKQVGQAQNVTVLDLTTRTTTWLQQLGPNGWHPYFAQSSMGKFDSTHLNQAGANIVAGFIRDLIKDAQVPVLSAHFR
jgi:lysophospholipase L1-like esterase